MKKLPIWFWVAIGAGALLAYSFGHRSGTAKATSAEALRQSNEAAVPLQEFTQPQPHDFGASPYGSAQGTVTSTPTQNVQTVYTGPIGAFVG